MMAANQLNNTEALERADRIIEHLLYDRPIYEIGALIQEHDRFMDAMRSLLGTGPQE